MISIIIPTYQHGDALKRCLDSLYTQTYKDFEVIVVNDGSTDNTVNILNNYPQKITVISQKNSGANVARNNGAKIAKGDYLLFCDADIVATHNMLEEMKNALDKNRQVAYAYSDFMWGAKVFRLYPFDKQELRRKNYIHTSSLMRRDCFPGFDETINRFQDWDLWLTMLKSGHTGIYIPKILFSVKPRKSGMSGWLPSIVYKIPWKKFGIRIKRLETYQEAERVIKAKHLLA
ncbi:MAG: glycosyltransferase family A protein [Patescibacteria group bacterium]|jgi:glycosyltransferase involved in cell wall biosynthesis